MILLRKSFLFIAVLSLVSVHCAAEESTDTNTDNTPGAYEVTNEQPLNTQKRTIKDTQISDENKPFGEAEKATLNGDELLKKAKNLLDYGDYPAMIEVLKSGLKNKAYDQKQLVEVNRMLGIGYFIIKNEPSSREHFLRLLTKEPDTTLDPLYVPPPIIEFFNQIKNEHKELLDAIRKEQAKGDEKPEEIIPIPTKRVEKIKNPYFVNFIPFGAGQFQNEQNVKGSLFLTSQVLTLGLNIGAYFASRELRSDNGYYTPDNADKARTWRIVQYSAIGAFAALVVGGVVDAVLNYQEFREIEVEDTNEKDTKQEGVKVSFSRLRIEF